MRSPSLVTNRASGYDIHRRHELAKSEPIEVEATVTTALPNAMFKLRLDQGGQTREILGHVSGKMRKHFIRILPGDIVTVAISPYDPSKGRITYRGPLRQVQDAETGQA